MPEGMPAGMPSFWMPYFQVEDCDASVEKARQLGGEIVVPARDIPNTGRFAVVKDPQGAMFAAFKYTGGGTES
jgi:predicted enzyme related to lactoylglutathione lyase